MQLTAKNKVLISGIVGAAVLIAGFDMIMADFSAGRQFPGMDQGGVPGELYPAIMGVPLLAASGIISGACYTALDYTASLKATLLRSATSGAAACVLIFLASCAFIVVSASVSGPAQAAVSLFTGAFDIAPLFFAILLLLAFFGVLGGAGVKLTLAGLRLVNKKL